MALQTAKRARSVSRSTAFPRNAQVAWDANPSSEAVTAYNVTLNGTPVGSVAASPMTVSIPAEGQHVIGVSAVNTWGASAEAQVTILAVVPGVPANLRVVPV